MGQLTQTTAQVQVILDDADAANVGKTSLTDGSDTTSVAFKKSGFYSLQGSSANAPSTDRAVLISAVRDTAATGEIRYGQIAITESNGLWWNRDDGGSLGTWYEAVTTASAQTLTNKTLTSPVLTTPQINDSAADHQYIFAGSDLAADRTVTLPLLTGDDTFVFAAHTQTLTNKTLTTPTVSGLTLSDSSIIFEGATANDYETTLTVTDPTADRTITLPDATDTLVGRATTDTLTNKTLTSPVASGLTLSDASIVFEGATADAHETTLTVTDPTADRIITLPNATDTLVGLATTDTLTNKTLTSPVLNTGVSGTAVLDADDFTGASATTLATSESIKAYVDSQVGSFDTLSEVLAAGNTTGSNDIAVDTTQKVQFRDAAIYVNSSSDGQLDIVADTTVQIDSGGTITLDADTDGQVAFKDGGTQYGLISKAVNNLILKSSVVDGDVIIQGTDSGGTVTAATFDMSNSGAATFGGAVTADAGISVDNINIDGTTIALSSGDLTLDVAGDINLDADGGDIRFKDGGTEFYKVAKNGDHVQLFSTIQNGDLTFNGFDDSSHIVALTLDMSEAGAATFNAGATIKSTGVNNTPADLSLWHTDVSIVSGDDLAVISAEGSDSGGSAPYQGAKILFDAAANWDTGSSNYYPTNIKLFTQDNSGTDTIAAGPRMTILSSGSVGIGTDSPAINKGSGTAQALHLYASAAAPELRIQRGNGTDFSITASTTGGGANIFSSHGMTFYANSSTRAFDVDTSGNLLVGKTTTALATAGLTFGAAGFASLTRDGAEPLSLNRLTDAGKLAVFYQAGTEFGSISKSSTRFTIEGPDNPIRIVTGTSNIQINHDTHITFDTAGSERVRVNTTEMVINEDSNEYDFRVESNDNANMLKVDGTNNRVGIGKSPASNPFEVAGYASFDSGASFSGRVMVGTSVAPHQKLTVTGASGSADGVLSNGILALTTGTGVIADTRLLMGIVDDSYAWLQAADYGVAYRSIVLNPNGGNVGIFNTSPTSYTGSASNSLVLGNSSSTTGSHGMTIVAGNQATSSIAFSDHAGDGGTTDYRGLFQYVHSDDSLRVFTASTERFRIASDGVANFNGDVKVLSGDIQMGSGRGINFSASSHFSGMTSETLDDYEEGTWTPTVSFGGASVSVVYTANTNGRYVKVGGVVHVSGCLFLSSKGSSTGDAAIGGLPFGMLNSAEGTKASATIGQLSGVSFTAYPSMLASGSALYLYDTTTGGTLAAIDNSNLTDGTSIYFTASYAAA